MRTINGAAVLEYGNHLPSFHEPPLGFVVRTTIPDKGGTCKSSQNSVVRMDSHRFRIEMEFMLTNGFWLLTTRKNREVLQLAQDTPMSAIKRPFSFRQAEDGKSLPYSKTAAPL